MQKVFKRAAIAAAILGASAVAHAQDVITLKVHHFLPHFDSAHHHVERVV